MTANEKVSIVVPVYNAAAYLEKTVEMVRSQTFSDWELILVNDHSADDSQKILDRMAAQDAPQGKISTLQSPVFSDCFDGIFTAGWPEPAFAGEGRRNAALVKADEAEQCVFHRFSPRRIPAFLARDR